VGAGSGLGAGVGVGVGGRVTFSGGGAGVGAGVISPEVEAHPALSTRSKTVTRVITILPVLFIFTVNLPLKISYTIILYVTKKLSIG